LKSYSISDSGEEQITGFHLPSEIVGLEGINTGSHVGFSETLVPSLLCAIPYDKLDNLNSKIDGLRQQLFKIMSQEITHNHELMLMLNQKNADEKIATFLLSLSVRESLGKGLTTQFVLPMTRTDIANYLGLALETVSRIIGKLIKQDVISVDHRQVTINKVNILSGLAGISCHFVDPNQHN
jgi:CRP/FNR family transcriptional regulator